MTTSRPSWWASRAVGFAALALPPGGRRDRYRQEFYAELYGMDHSQQLRHALGVLAQAGRCAALRECARCGSTFYQRPTSGLDVSGMEGGFG